MDAKGNNPEIAECEGKRFVSVNEAPDAASVYAPLARCASCVFLSPRCLAQLGGSALRAVRMSRFLRAPRA
eukprot:152930-Alexandrium_andersonii.AAC.1